MRAGVFLVGERQPEKVEETHTDTKRMWKAQDGTTDAEAVTQPRRHLQIFLFVKNLFAKD